MEYKELSSISANLESYIPFGLNRCDESNIFCAITRTKAQVLELSYQHHHEGSVRFIQSSVSYPSHVPSQDIQKDYTSIYEGAEMKYRNEIQLNPLLIPEMLLQTELTYALVAARFAPRIINQNGLHLATLSNYGGCEIAFKTFGERTWNSACALSQFWTAHCQQNYPVTIVDCATLRKYVADTQLTALCWNNGISEDELQLCTISASGILAFIRLEVPSEIQPESKGMLPQILFEQSTDLIKVNMMEWITFIDKQMKKHSYVVVADVVGDVALLRIDATNDAINNVQVGANLWNEGDKIRAEGLKWSFDMKSEQFIIVYCKGSHVFCHLLSKSGKPLAHSVHYIEGLFITGIHQLNNLGFLVGTLNGHLEHVAIEITNNDISCSGTRVQHEINSAKYLLYGLTASTNNAFLLSALFIGQHFDHLKFRETATILIQQSPDVNVLLKLQQNKMNKLTFKHDYAELFRCIQSTSDVFLDYFDHIPSPIEFTDEYLYKLKVRLIATSARSTHFRRRGLLLQADTILSEFEIVKKFLFAIRCCRGIKYLTSIATPLTGFQDLSIKCQRAFVRQFLSTDLTEIYEQLRIEFQPDLEVLLTETESNIVNIVEKCVYCDELIDGDRLTCAENHDMPRCCLSMVQIPLLNKRSCVQCQLVTFDDLECLVQLFPNPANEIMCPLCDLPFTDCALGLDYS